jgi:O-antigen/teichoic acid export membrane protein
MALVHMRKLTISPSLRGVAVIYSSLILALVFGLISSSLTARSMSTTDLGQYRYLISCITVTVSATTLGLFSSAGALLAAPGSRTFQNLVTEGANAQGWFVAASTAICVASVFLFQSPSGSLGQWAVAAVLSMFMAWPVLMQEILRARGRFMSIALLNAAPSLLFILAILLFKVLDFGLNAALCVCAYFLSQGLIVFLVRYGDGLKLKPTRVGYAFLFKRNKRLGLNVYFGTFLAALTAQSGILLLQAFRASEDVGVFSLANTLTAPLTLLPSTIGTVFFSRLPNAPGFPRRVLAFTWTTSAAIALVFCVSSPFIIQVIYGSRFESVVLPAQICAVASMLQGVGDVYNRYYLANKDTSFLLYIAIGVCFTAIIVGAAGAVYFGVLGAAAAKMIGSLTYVFVLFLYYHFLGHRFG